MKCPKCQSPALFGEAMCAPCARKANRPSPLMVNLPIVEKVKSPVESKQLFDKDFVLNVGDINVTSQGDKIVIAKRNGNAYNVVLEMDIEQALAVGIAIRSVATCAKYSKG